MPAEHSDPVQWDKVASELHAAREAQQRTWGDIDSDSLGRYLADEASSTERAAIENAFETLPELKRLTDVIRDVLADCGPAEPVAPVTVPAASPATVPFTRPEPFVRKSRWGTVRQRGAMLAAACLMLAVGGWLFRPEQGNRPTEPTGPTRLADAQASLHKAGLEDTKKLDNADTVDLVYARVAKLNEQMAENQTKGDYETALAAATEYAALAENVTLRTDRRYAPKVAEGWNRVGLVYQAVGDLDRAEQQLARNLEVNRKALGENHEATRKACVYLAGVYQNTVATRNEPQPLMMKMTPAATDSVKDKTRLVREESCARFQDRMNRPEVRQKIRHFVVPVLAQALQDSKDANQRVETANALANLGPLAQDAAPIVVDCLANSQDMQERLALIRALNQMGPATDGAVPVLVQAFKQCESTETRRSIAFYLATAPAGQAMLNEVAAKGKADEKKCAAEALQRPRGGR